MRSFSGELCILSPAEYFRTRNARAGIGGGPNWRHAIGMVSAYKLHCHHCSRVRWHFLPTDVADDPSQERRCAYTRALNERAVCSRCKRRDVVSVEPVWDEPSAVMTRYV